MEQLLKLDEKDRKILSELDRNSRQTDSEIAKKVLVSKQVANYRIQNLEKKGIITNFYTLINVGRLGLNSYYIFLQLENINKEQENKLLHKIKILDYVGWLVSGTGRWDAILLVYADSTLTFDKLLNNIIGICGKHLHEYNFTTLVEAEHIGYKLITKNKELLSAKQTEKAEKQELDNIDKLILASISQNSRKSIVDISKEVRKPIHVINYHLKSMIKNKIIEGFKPKINVNKLGYQWHLLLIQFQNITPERKKEFISFCKNHSKIYYVTNTIGLYNVMLDIHVKSSEEFKEMLLELKEKFSDIIKLYESMVLFDEYKIDYFPKKLV